MIFLHKAESPSYADFSLRKVKKVPAITEFPSAHN
jgi:hypothetical protein